MSDFEIDLKKVENVCIYIGYVQKNIQQIAESIEEIKKKIRTDVANGSLKNISKEIQVEKARVEILQEKLNEIIFLFKETEDGIKETDIFIVNFRNTQKGIISEHNLDSIVFDNEGKYGGDQGRPQKKAKEYYDIVKKYYPEITDLQIETLLRKLNSEGCGYVAIINTIFAEFEGREEEFEKVFGFSMYNDENDLNFDALLVDFYCATDNKIFKKNGKVEINNYEDYDSDVDGQKEDYKALDDMTGRGTTSEERENRAVYYLDQKGIHLEVEKTKKVTIDNYKKLAKEGYIMIGFHNGNLQDIDGNKVQYINGGHAMTVTGVTSDGRFIVSSWGEKYYIDPEEVIIRETEDGKEIKTSMNFSYYQYQ